jgi:hypothetical protein
MIIGIAGKARSGKNQFAEYLVKFFKEGFKRDFWFGAFADRLKAMCIEHFDLARNQVYGDQKEVPDKRYRKQGVKPYCEGLGKDKLPASHWTPREIMQAIGGFYRTIDYSFWVKEFDKVYRDAHNQDVIITDIRHINECEYVRANRGLLIKVFRDSNEEIHGMNHESETALDDYKDFDIYINNSGTLEELEQAAFDTVNVITSIEKYVSEGGVYHGE